MSINNKELQIKRVLVNEYFNYPRWWIYELMKHDDAVLLKKNKKFKKKFSGKRCFVLGNGPSLKDVDFSLLEKEYVFTVNQIARHPDFIKLNSNFHLWADHSFFELDKTKPEDGEVLDLMRLISLKSDTFSVYPIGEREFIEKNGLYKKGKTFFFNPRIFLYSGYKGDFSYDKYTFLFSTVVHYCVSLAIYMGFRKIYLLGCDGTGIISFLNRAIGESVEGNYIYNITANEDKRMLGLLENNSMENYIKSFLSVYREFRLLNQYCKEQNIVFANCSSTTAIDCVPRMSLEVVLSEKDRISTRV